MNKASLCKNKHAEKIKYRDILQREERSLQMLNRVNKIFKINANLPEIIVF